MTQATLESRLIRLFVPLAAAAAIFYAFLLVFVPLVRSARGELPIELSFRGARWEADASAVNDLEERLSTLSDEVEMLSESVARMRVTARPSPPPAP